MLEKTQNISANGNAPADFPSGIRGAVLNGGVRVGGRRLPGVFDYKDYRKYLAEWLEAKKSAHTSYSGAMFARKAGLNSHSFLGMVIRGDRNLSAMTIRAFARALSLDGAEGSYFEKLVLFNQSANPRDKEYYLDQLTALARGSARSVFRRIQDHTHYLGRWYVLAIRELVAMASFQPDGVWISRKLGGKVSAQQAEEAWQLLLNIGAVERDAASGRYRLVEPNIDIDPGAASMAVRRYHLDFLDLTRDLATNGSMEERELCSLMMTISRKELPKLRERLRQFRVELNKEFASDPDQADELITVNTQLLVLSRPADSGETHAADAVG